MKHTLLRLGGVGLLIPPFLFYSESVHDPELVALSCVVLLSAGVSLMLAPAARWYYSPVTLSSLMLALLFGISPLARASDGVLPGVVAHSENLVDATAVAALASATFAVGVCTERLAWMGKRRHSLNIAKASGSKQGTGPRSASRILRVFFMVGLALFSIHVLRVGGLGSYFAGRSQSFNVSSSQYLSVAPLLGSVGATLVICHQRVLSRRYAIALCVIVGLSGLAFLGPGYRRFLLPATIIPALTYISSRGVRIGIKRGLAVALVLGGLVIVAPNIRSAGARENAGGWVPIVTETLSSPRRVLDSTLRGHETEMVGALALQLESPRRIGDYDFGYATFGDLVIAPLPSAVLPWKPMSGRDSNLIRVFGSPCVTTGPDPICPDFSFVGTLDQDGGFVAVAFGMFLAGIGLSHVERRSSRFGYGAVSPAILATLAVLAPITLRAGASPGLTWLLMYLVPLLSADYIARRRQELPRGSEAHITVGPSVRSGAIRIGRDKGLA